jgi:hypothetical protein
MGALALDWGSGFGLVNQFRLGYKAGSWGGGQAP